MIDIVMHVENEDNHWDENVFVEFKLPCAPAEGDVIRIEKTLESILENKANSSTTKEHYLEQWGYRGGISFSDAIYVKTVKFKSNDNRVYLVMTSI